MTAIHTEALAIFGGLLHNEVEKKINFVKFRPTLPYNSKSPMNITIPGNSSQYVLLCDSYLFVHCHVEETDQYGNPIETLECPKRSLEEEEQDADEPTMGPLPNGSRVKRSPTMRGSKKKEAPTFDEVEDYLEDVEKKWMSTRKAWAEYETERDEDEKKKKKQEAIALKTWLLQLFKSILKPKID